MTAPSSDPLQSIYTYLEDALHLSAQGDSVLAFLNPATLIDPDGFKLHPDDTALNPALATQEFTRLTNLLFGLDGASVTPRLEHLSVQYEMLLKGAQPLSVGAMGSLGAIRGVAEQLFEDNTVGFTVRQGEPPILAQYHPSQATPATWYDPAAAQNWPHFSTASSDSTPGPGRPPRPIPQRLPRLEWRVLPAELRPVTQRPELLGPLARAFQLRRLDSAVESTGVPDTAAPVPAPPSPPASPARLALLPLLSATHLTAFSAAPISSAAVSAVVRDHRTDAGTTPVAAEVRDHRRFAVSQTLSEAVLSPGLAEFIGTLPTAPVKSSSLNITFQYAVVEIDRPWFSAEYLQTPGWYLPGYRAGELTQGHSGEGGPLATLPTHLVFTRGISISGQWTPEDVMMANKSLSLGPFNLLGGSFDSQQTTFTCPGLFLLGVVLHRLPSLPPASDPGLPVAPPPPAPALAAAPLDGSVPTEAAPDSPPAQTPTDPATPPISG